MRSTLLLLALSLSIAHGIGDAPSPLEDIDAVLVAFVIPVDSPDAPNALIPVLP